VPADTGTADGDDADLLVVPVAELLPQRRAVGQVGWVKPVTYPAKE
jgi:hypothetical protein